MSASLIVTGLANAFPAVIPAQSRHDIATSVLERLLVKIDGQLEARSGLVMPERVEFASALATDPRDAWRCSVSIMIAGTFTANTVIWQALLDIQSIVNRWTSRLDRRVEHVSRSYTLTPQQIDCLLQEGLP